jgi:tryptophan synthase beta chain
MAAPGPTTILLDESEQPTRWYQPLHDLPTAPPPALHPGTLAPIGPQVPA